MNKYLILLISVLVMSCTSQKKNPTYLIETSVGNIEVVLYDKTPIHSANFDKLVEEGYYDGVLFHRVIKNFMIQSGNAETKTLTAKDRPEGDGEPDYTLEAEFVSEYIHKKGVLAAARHGDDENPEQRSSGSQFYIVQGKKFTEAQLQEIEESNNHYYSKDQKEVYKTIGGTPHLDGRYTIFGEVVSGLDVVDKIAVSPTASDDFPVADIRIIRIVKK